MLEPLVITPGGLLIAGGRRHTALSLLVAQGLIPADQPVPVHIRDDIEVAIGEFVENEQRKDLTLSEKVAQWREVEPLLREAARKRQHHVDGARAKGRLRDDMKRITGTGGRTMEKAIRIVEAAEADPKKFGHLVDYMDKRGADGAVEQMKIIQAGERVMAGIPPPEPVTRPKREVDGRPHLICQEIRLLVPDDLDAAIMDKGHQIRVGIDAGKITMECECGVSFRVPYLVDGQRCINECGRLIVSHYRWALEWEGQGT